jgi:hypothetical protein
MVTTPLVAVVRGNTVTVASALPVGLLALTGTVIWLTIEGPDWVTPPGELTLAEWSAWLSRLAEAGYETRQNQ